MSLKLERVSFQHTASTPPVIAELSLNLEPGERVVVLGANGSGKSTLLHLMAGLLLPDQGRVTVDGIDTQNVAQSFELRQSVGIVFQHPDYQVVSQTVEDDVAFGLENLNLPSDQIGRRVYDTLTRVGLRDAATRSPDSLSGGQLQRLALAGVLALGPRYLLMDEPFAWLDPPVQQQLWDTLQEVVKEGRALVVVTHQTDLLAETDRVWLMHKGRLIADTTPGRLGEDPGVFERAGLPAPALLKLTHKLRKNGIDTPPWFRVRDALEWLKSNVQTLAVESTDTFDLDSAVETEKPIEVRRVGFAHDKHAKVDDWLLCDVNFGLLPQDWVTLSGPSGCGKSTFVQLLNGLLKPLAGSIALNGRSIAGQTTAQLCRRVGLVFQNPREQCFALTVREEMGFALLDGGASPHEVDARIQQVCGQLKLSEELLGRPPHTLSGGEQIKVALGAALLLQPQVLILDETLTALDPTARLEMVDLLYGLNRNGLALITVSHRPQHTPLAKRFAWLEDTRMRVYERKNTPQGFLPEVAQLGARVLDRRTEDVGEIARAILALTKKTR